ncbi:MAG: galactokinase, partial [Deltaproteobacteria bacterium]
AGFYRAGIATGGFDALVVADLPPGAGLSSSAALEVSCATALEGLCGKRLSQRDKARLCHQAEHEFAGVPCGIMDQFISVMAEPGHLLLIDCASEETRQIAFSGEEMAVLVVDSGLPHELARGGLARRRDECERAAEALGVVTLRELDAAAFKTAAAGLEPVLYRRASHVISENRRTLAAVAALETADWQGLGRILAEGHVSQRQDFESTCPEIDWLVRFAHDDIGPSGGVLGSRMTGGGFGGSTISLVEARRADEIGTRIGQAYRDTLGRDCTWFVARPSAGCRLLETAG